MAHESSTLPNPRPARGAPVAVKPAPAPALPRAGSAAPRPAANALKAARAAAPAPPRAASHNSQPPAAGVPDNPASSPPDWAAAWTAAIGAPRMATFEALAGSPLASAARAYQWLGAAALAAWTVPAAASLARGGLPAWALLAAALSLAALTLVWYTLAQWSAHIVAGHLGKPAPFERLAYPAAAFCAPLVIVAGALLAGPAFMRLLLLPLLAYGFYLEALAIRAAHRLTWPQTFVAAAPGTLLMLVPLAAVAGIAVQLL